MAAQRKHKKIDRTGVLPRQLTGIVKLLALLGAALKDVLFGSFYALPFAKMAFLALLCALVILTLFWMLLGILDAFGRRETAGRWILAFGVLLFFAAPLIAAPLDAYGQIRRHMVRSAQRFPFYASVFCVRQAAGSPG